MVQMYWIVHLHVAYCYTQGGIKVIDFKALKVATNIEEVARGFLSLTITEDKDDTLRAVCPSCESEDPRAIIITPSKGLFYCFKSEKGGDLISLVAHCHRTSLKDSAVELSKVYMDDESKPEPQKEERPKDVGGFNPLTYLDMDHPLVEELGFKSIADKAGIGYAGKGMMRSHLAIPIRLPDGRLVGYLGVKGDVKVPLKWKVA